MEDRTAKAPIRCASLSELQWPHMAQIQLKCNTFTIDWDDEISQHSFLRYIIHWVFLQSQYISKQISVENLQAIKLCLCHNQIWLHNNYRNTYFSWSGIYRKWWHLKYNVEALQYFASLLEHPIKSYMWN